MINGWKKKMALLALILVASALVLPILPTSPPTSATQVVSSDGWGWVNPLPQGNDLQGVWSNSANNVWAVGDAGTILHYAGSSWSSVASATSNHLYGVWGSSSSDIFAVGASGRIVHYNGSTWSTQDSGTSNTINGVWGTASNNVYAAGDSGTILKYNGSSWSSSTAGSANLNGIWGNSASDIFAVGASGTILHYDGSSWSSTTSGSANLDGVWGNSSSNMYAVGDSGTILKYDGTAWASQSSGTSNNLNAVWGTSSSNVYAVGDSGTVSTYNGTSWSATSGSENLNGVWGSSASDIFAVGGTGTIRHYDGSSWSSVNSTIAGGTTHNIYSVWCNSTSDVFVVGASGTIRHYDGSSWSSQTPPGIPPYNDLWALWGANPNNVFASGVSGTTLKYDGSSWSSLASGTSKDLYGLWGSASNDVFAVGDADTGASTLLHYTGGSSWLAETITSDPIQSLCALWGTASDNVYAVGHNRTILHYDGGSWTVVTSGSGTETLYGVWGSSASDIYAVGAAVMYHYDGSSWTSGTRGETLRDVWGTSSTDIYAVGTIGNIIRHTGGAWNSWSSVSSGTVRDLWTVRPTTPSSNNYYAVGMSGTILRYPSPSITSISPNSGLQGQTLDVTITGSSLAGGTGLSFGSGITVSNTSYSATQITAQIAIDSAATTGPRDITVTTPSDSAILAGGFTVIPPPPTITLISPSQGTQGQTVSVTITGTYLTGATAVSFGDGITVSFNVDSATQITASAAIGTGASTGARTVSVTTAGGTATSQNAFTINVATPTVTSILPTQGIQGNTLTVTVTGTYLTGTTAVSFGDGITVNSSLVDSATQITSQITISTSAATGSRDVSVTTPGGTGTLTGGFTVLPPVPTITAIDPTNGKQGQSLDVTITGTDFTGVTDVSFGEGIAINTLNVDDATQITVNITIAKDAATGLRDVSVTTASGTGTLTAGFTVKEKNGGGCCGCGQISEPTPPSELLIGWGILISCAAAAYWAATRVGKQKTKPISGTLGRP